MKKLTKKEDQIMQVIWRKGAAFIREVIEELPEPRPHYNTVATLVKILEKKEFLKAERLGNSYRYSPSVEFEAYRDDDLQEIKQKYFGNSFPKMLTHFAKSEKLSEAEIEELIEFIKQNNQDQ